MNPLIPGFALIFLAAAAGGMFAVPYKMQRTFKWENTWPVGFFFALIFMLLVTTHNNLPVSSPSAANRLRPPRQQERLGRRGDGE